MAPFKDGIGDIGRPHLMGTADALDHHNCGKSDEAL